MHNFSKMHKRSSSRNSQTILSDALIAALELTFDTELPYISSHCLRDSGLTFNLGGNHFTFDAETMMVEETFVDGRLHTLVGLKDPPTCPLPTPKPTCASGTDVLSTHPDCSNYLKTTQRGTWYDGGPCCCWQTNSSLLECPAPMPPSPPPPPFKCYARTKKLCNSDSPGPAPAPADPSLNLYISKCQWVNDKCCKTGSVCDEIDPSIINLLKRYPEIVEDNIFDLTLDTGKTNECTFSNGKQMCTNFYTWSNFVKAITLFNKYVNTGYCAQPSHGTHKGSTPLTRFLNEPDDTTTNIKILAAFFSNTIEETGNYKKCNEDCTTGGCAQYPATYCTSNSMCDHTILPPINYTIKCIPDKPSESDGHFSPDDLSTIKCIRSGTKYTDAACFFGRGSIQTTYLQNYNNLRTILNKIPVKALNLDPTLYSNGLDIIQFPDLICSNGIIAWLTGIAYITSVCPNKYSMIGVGDKDVCAGMPKGGASCTPCNSDKTHCEACYMAVQCVKGGGATKMHTREDTYLNYLKKLGL